MSMLTLCVQKGLCIFAAAKAKRDQLPRYINKYRPIKPPSIVKLAIQDRICFVRQGVERKVVTLQPNTA